MGFRRHFRAFLPSLGVRSLGRWVGYGVLVGIISGLGAVIFYLLLDATSFLLFDVLAGRPMEHPRGEPSLFSISEPRDFIPWLFFLMPAIGGLISGIIVQRWSPEAAGVGTEELIDSFHNKHGQIRTRVPIVKAIATVFTLGFGGASGREGPIAQMGGGFGSWLARKLKLNRRERRILLLAGAAGGFGAIFRAPLGGAITAVEVLYREDLETDALVPSVITSVTAYAIFTAIFGFDPIFALPQAEAFTQPHELIFYVLLGLVCVPFGAATVQIFHGIRRLFERLRFIPLWALPAIGGLLVGVTGLVAPGVYGSGWGQVQRAIDGNLAIQTMLILVGAKAVAMSLTLGSGGSGGVFGPTLFIGAMLGGVFGGVSHYLFPGLAPDQSAVVIVAMCAFFAGVANAPLGALLMTMEMSQSYGLVAPLMLVSVIAVLFTSRWSIFVKQVRNKFHSPAHQGDLNVNVLQGLEVKDVMRPASEVQAIPKNARFQRIREMISRSENIWFPVVDEEARLVGVLSLNDARAVIFRRDLDNLLLAADAAGPPISIDLHEDLYAALLQILHTGCGEIPVIDAESGTLVGELRHSDVLRAYHGRILEGGDEEEEAA